MSERQVLEDEKVIRILKKELRQAKAEIRELKAHISDQKKARRRRRPEN